MKEKIQTRVTAGEKGWRVVFGEGHGGVLGEGGEGVIVGDHKVHEGVGFGGGGRRGTHGGRWLVNLGWTEERTRVWSHIGRSWVGEIERGKG